MIRLAGADPTFASWALPIVLLFRRPSSAIKICSRSLSRSSQRASRLLVVPSRVRLREFGQVNAGRPRRGGGPVIPQLVRGVRDDRGQQPGQVIVQGGQHKLGGPPVRARGGLGVKPVFQDIEVETRKLDRAELVDPLVDPVKLKSFVRGPDVTDDLVELAEGPAIDFMQRWRGRRRRGSNRW